MAGGRDALLGDGRDSPRARAGPRRGALPRGRTGGREPPRCSCELLSRKPSRVGAAETRSSRPWRSSDAEDPLEAVKKITEEMRKLMSTNWISDSEIFQDPDDFNFSSSLSFGALAAIGVTVFAVIVITIILCLTCSCCCLYKACRRPRPVVTTTATTTVVHSAYPQQPAVPPSYPAAPYQGYQPVAVQPQPGMPVAPYPAQYPPPYPMQPAGPPAYHETVAAGAGAPYPTQPPYNPAYMDPQKPTY
ncbi:protein shisa-5 isoform X1 [Vidua chalybeata]|uniref:protein shisa-5 isoform X1 n=2 Tax=Vidua chalybeata TaxID=81927 RepID=UPI0023A7EAAD|nr:protein shisa-5 isoform X1 [Vidua chalybeata]